MQSSTGSSALLQSSKIHNRENHFVLFCMIESFFRKNFLERKSLVPNFCTLKQFATFSQETEYHSTQREHHESYPPPAPVARTRSLWQAVNHPPAAGYYHGPIPLRSPRTQRVPRPLRSPRSPRVLTKQAASNWSSSSPGSDRQSASTGDIDFSWVREEEGRLRRKDKASLPECYFGMEDETHAVGHKQGFIVRPKMRQACKNRYVT